MKHNIEMNEIEKSLLKGREYIGASKIEGPLVYMRNTHPVGFGELVEVVDSTGSLRTGQVLDTSDDVVIVQLFEGTDGLNLPSTKMRFMGEPFTLNVYETSTFLSSLNPTTPSKVNKYYSNDVFDKKTGIELKLMQLDSMLICLVSLNLCSKCIACFFLCN